MKNRDIIPNHISRKKQIMFAGIMVTVTLIIGFALIFLGNKIRKTRQFAQFVSLEEKIKKETDPYKKAVFLVPVPFTGFHCYPNIHGETCNTNDLGYRNKLNYQDMIKYAENLKAKGYKIGIFTGGSAAFGYFSSSDETTIPGVLNSLFKYNGQKVYFFNFGMSSYTSDQELVALVIYAAALNPDILVVMDGHNDILHVTYDSPLKDFASHNREPYNIGAGIDYGFPTIRLLYEKAFGLKYSSEFLDREYNVSDSSSFVKEESLHETLKFYRNNLYKMCCFMKGIGGKTVLLPQPILQYRNKLRYPDYSKWSYLKRLYTVYDKIEEAVRNVAKEEGVLFVDGAGVFEDLDENVVVFDDKVHMNDKGQRMVAEKIFNDISENNFIK